MISLSRLRSAFRALGWNDPVYRWRLSRADCPGCGGRWFLSMKAHPFMTRCLGCGANVTNLSLIPVVRRHAAVSPVQTCWEMSTYGATLLYLKKTFPVVHESEYFPHAQPGERVEGIVNQDVQRLSFDDASLDLITSSQVFEHVPDDLRGFAECHRVLRPGGALVFTVPLHDIGQTRRIAELVDGRPVFHGEPEYHDSRRGGPRSALTFWHHSLSDICARVAQAGFRTQLESVWITPRQGSPALVVYARKDQGAAQPDAPLAGAMTG